MARVWIGIPRERKWSVPSVKAREFSRMKTPRVQKFETGLRQESGALQ